MAPMWPLPRPASATSSRSPPLRQAPAPIAGSAHGATVSLRGMLHVQANPLPICTRPRVLIKGKRT